MKSIFPSVFCSPPLCKCAACGNEHAPQISWALTLEQEEPEADVFWPKPPDNYQQKALPRKTRRAIKGR